MLTFMEERKLAMEMQECYDRLNPNRREVLIELKMNEAELERTLKMKNADPDNVIKLCDYLEKKLAEKGEKMITFSWPNSLRDAF